MSRKLISLALAALTLSGSVVPALAQDDEGLTIWTDETRAPVIQEIGDAFTEEYGIPVTVVQLGFGDIRDQLITAGPAGEGADIIIGAHDWLGQLVENGLVAPLDLPEDIAANFVPVSLEAFTYNGQLYGLPYAIENVAFYRNTDLVPEAPATWDEVATVSQELIDSGASQYGFVLQSGDPYHMYGILTAFGGYVFGKTDEGYDAEDVGIDSEGSVAALEYLTGLVEAGTLPVTTGDEATALFESGDAAMIISGPWFIQRFTDAGLPFAVSPIPAGPGGPGAPFLGVQGFMVNSFSDNPDLALAFLTDYLATEEAMTAIFESGDRPSAYSPVLETITDENLLAFGEAGTVGNPMPAIPEMSSVWSAWGDAETLALQGQVTAADAFANAAQQIRNLIAGITPEPEATAEATAAS